MSSSPVGAAVVARRVAVVTGLELDEAEVWCTLIRSAVDELLDRGCTVVGEQVELGDVDGDVLHRLHDRFDLLTDDDLDALHAIDVPATAAALELDVELVAAHPLATSYSVASLTLAAAGHDVDVAPELVERVLHAVETWMAALPTDQPYTPAGHGDLDPVPVVRAEAADVAPPASVSSDSV
ncbi:MAG: hypothetical protein Q7T56_11000 [Nocardioidaceae bacterium]|nr:hypothetical protein [Nocardioidaceae bacterium]